MTGKRAPGWELNNDNVLSATLKCPVCGGAGPYELGFAYGNVVGSRYSVGETLTPPDDHGYDDEEEVVVQADVFESAGHLAHCGWDRRGHQGTVRVIRRRLDSVVLDDARYRFDETTFNGACTPWFLPCPYLRIDSEGKPVPPGHGFPKVLPR